jgi:hypothetical protein
MDNGLIFPYHVGSFTFGCEAMGGRRRVGQPVNGFRCQACREMMAAGKSAA